MTDSRESVTGKLMAGVILAGGRSRRMDGLNKSLAPVAGKPLIQWLIDYASPQLDMLAINGDPNIYGDLVYGDLGLPVVPDLEAGFKGPMMGVYSAMDWYARQGRDGWLVVLPCDTPFLPEGVPGELVDTARRKGVPAAVAAVGEQLHPTVSAWHFDLLPEIRRGVLDNNIAGFREFLGYHPHAILDFGAASAPLFMNINTPADLAAAEQILESEHVAR